MSTNRKTGPVNPSAKKTKDVQPNEEEPLPESGNNVFHGSNGSKYEGEWKRIDGVIKRQGKGIYTCNEFKYEGEFEDDLFNGHGTIEFSDGRKYEGDFVKGQIQGEGQMEFEDQSVYNGQWFHGRMHGIGTFSTIMGEKWTGQWCHGMSTCPIFPQVIPPQSEEETIPEDDMMPEEEFQNEILEYTS